MTSNYNHPQPNKGSGHRVTFGHSVINSNSASSAAAADPGGYQTKARVFLMVGSAWECLRGNAGPVSVSLKRIHPIGAAIFAYPDNYTGDSSVKPLLESHLTVSSAFLMTTSKFGAWRDPSGTTYGLGFSSVPERDNFANAFTAMVDSLKDAEASRGKEEESFPIMTTSLMQDMLETNRVSQAESKEIADKKKSTEKSAEERLFGVMARLKAECEEVKRGSLERREAEEALQTELASKDKELMELRSQMDKERRSRMKAENELKEALAEAGVLRERLRQMEAEVERAEEERSGVDKILDGDLNIAVHVLVNTISSLRSANNLSGNTHNK